jgi:hypothetical protein
MEAVRIFSGSAASSGSKTSVFIPSTMNDSLNRNITGHAQMCVTSGTGTPTVAIEGSANGSQWITIVNGLTSTNGFHIALFPHMRANVTTTAASTTIDVFVVV